MFTDSLDSVQVLRASVHKEIFFLFIIVVIIINPI